MLLDQRTAFDHDGYCITPQVIAADAVAPASSVMDRVIAGDYETGVAPFAVSWHPGDDPTRLVKIDQPQMADPAITEMLVDSQIGRIAADLFDADFIQCWAVQLLYKPGGGADVGNVGWHQDDDYWSQWWTGELFTCWLALSEVTAESGPMRFVRGSHKWGFLENGNFFSTDLAGGQSAYQLPDGAEWIEDPALMGAGHASFHDRRTIHGSGPNTSASPRRSYAVHLRTERSTPMGNEPPQYREQLADQMLCPVLYQR